MFNFLLKSFTTIGFFVYLILNQSSHSQASKTHEFKSSKAYQCSQNKIDKKYHTLKDLEFNYHKILNEIRHKLESESKQNNIQTNILDDIKKKIQILEIHHQEMINNLKSSAPTPKLNQKIEFAQIIDAEATEWVEDLKKAYNTKTKRKVEELLNNSQAEELPTTQKSVPSKTLNYDEQMIDPNFTPYKSVKEIVGDTEEHERQYD